MNNDISSELTKYINPRTKQISKKTLNTCASKNTQVNSDDSYETTQRYLGALGHAKVNMDNRTINSVNILKNDPEYVQNHIGLCDALQEKGYSLEDAVVGADIIFKKLKDKSTYTP